MDGSTDLAIKDMVEVECIKWASKGINIKYEIRDNRNGYKAGALKQGLKHNYVSQCDFVAIFDADLQPEPDFLLRTIPFFVHNHDIGLFQARWKFDNADECLMTRMQGMSLNYHFIVEQEKVNLWKKLCVLYSFFFVRKVVAHIVTFTFYCVVLPLSCLVAGVDVPIWGVIYILTTITLLNTVGTPRSIHLVIFWVIFENVMAMHRTKGTIIGLLEIGRVNEWVVTEKLGDDSKTNPSSSAPVLSNAPAKKSSFRIWGRSITRQYLETSTPSGLLWH